MIQKMVHGIHLAQALHDRREQHNKPIRVNIAPTSVCNYHCQFCWYHSSLREDNIPDVTMDVATMRELLDSLCKMEVANIVFAGNGEPFLHKELPQIIREYGSKFNIEVLTNGSLLSKLDLITYQSLARLTVSLNSGTGESHQKISGYKGENQWAGIVSQIKRFGGNVRINYVITEENEGEVAALRHLADVCHLKTAIRPIINEVAANGKLYHCYESYIQTFVDSDGDVLLCCWGKNKPMGNLHERDFEDIWRDKKNIELRRRAIEMKEPMFEACYDCTNVRINSVPFHNIYSKLRLMGVGNG